MNSHYSVLGVQGWTPIQWRNLLAKLYNITQKTRLKIPILYGIDSIHGATFVFTATLFPQQIGIGATFNESLAFQVGEIMSKDTRAAGIPW